MITMIKMAFFDIPDKYFPKGEPKNRFFPKYEPAIDFVNQIGKENVISYSFFHERAWPCVAIVYEDNELLTCPSCAIEISDSFDFCPKCGVKLK